MQQTALKLLRRDDLAGIRNLTSYVFTMLENGAKDLFKKKGRETVGVESEDGGGSLEEEVLKEELKQVILHAIERLDEKQKYVFVQTEIKGRSYDELVRETGEKLGTLLSRKSRAAKKLKAMIQVYLKED